MIEPFFINNQLFACYHPPGDAASRRLVVICPPLFDEYRRTYKALAELATALAQAGLHVLRFDYEGTGDSMGELRSVSAETWLENIHQVVEEGLALSGAEKVSLVGVRLGATLAANCRHSAIDAYVLWDPFSDGKAFLAQLEEIKAEIKKEHRQLARYAGAVLEDIDYSYFSLSAGLQASLAQLACACEQLPGCSVITTQPNSVFNNAEQTGFSYSWPYYQDGLLMPKPVLEHIARKVLQ